MCEIAPFDDTIAGLLRGDFSRLDARFEDGSIVAWCQQGRFDGQPVALAEAFTCACFNGRVAAAEFLLSRGADPSGGAATGLNALHWAVNRGRLEAVRLLLRHKTSLEIRNMYGGTALGTAVWSAIHEPRPDHVQIIRELIAAGARIEEAGYPTGNAPIDAVLTRF